MANYNAPIDDPYDTQSDDPNPITPPLDEIIQNAILASQFLFRVHLPCEIVKINGNQNVDVQPLQTIRYTDGTVSNMPVIMHVPVSMPMGDDYYLKFPLAIGDTGYCVFSDRNLDNWLAGDGSIADPEDSRTHDLSDAMFVPGMVPFANQTTDVTDDMVFTNGMAMLRWLKEGTFKFSGNVMNVVFDKDGNFTFTNGTATATFDKDGNYTFTNGTMTVHFNQNGTFSFSNGTNELMDLLVQITTQLVTLTETLSVDTVNTIFGPNKLNSFAEYESLNSTQSDLLSKLETLKG